MRTLSESRIRTIFNTGETIPDELADKLETHIQANYEGDAYQRLKNRNHALFALNQESKTMHYHFTGTGKAGMKPNPPDALITKCITKMTEKVKLPCNPTSGFVNAYPNGHHFCPFHRDNDEDVLMLGIGTDRKFVLKPKFLPW